MSTTPKLTTEIEAINLMLRAIGESPVSSIGGDTNVDVVTAKKLLMETSKEVQSEEWDFNSEDDYDFTPDAEDLIELPSNAIQVDADQETSREVVVHGSRLYDKKNHTYEFDSVVTCSVVWMHPWDNLPEAARAYIAIRAARKFQKDTVGSSELDGFKAEDEARARARLERYEAGTADHNILMGTGYMQLTMNRPGGRRYN